MSINTSDRTSSNVSPVYAFVVLSLAAFLTMFTLCRTPGIAYETETVFQLSDLADDTDIAQIRTSLAETMLAPEYVLDAMRSADIIRGQTSPETLEIAANIAKRMRLGSSTRNGENYFRLSLITERPNAGMELLNSMAQTVKPSDTDSSFAAYPARISRQRGGSLSAQGLILLMLTSSVVGLIGLVLCQRSKSSPILLSKQDITTVVGLPVIGDFFDKEVAVEAREKQVHRQRSFTFALRLAELGVAAVFALMLFHLATKDALLNRFISDPLAAYGEVLTQVIG